MEGMPSRRMTIQSLKLMFTRSLFFEKALVSWHAFHETGQFGSLLAGMIAPRSAPCLFRGEAMLPTLGSAPASITGDGLAKNQEMLVVRSLGHLLKENESFGWQFPDIAFSMLDREIKDKPDSDRLRALKETQFMSIFRPVNAGDVVLIRNPDRQPGPVEDPILEGLPAAAAGRAAGGEEDEDALPPACRAEFLVRRVAAVQGQELQSTERGVPDLKLEPGTCWVLADNQSLAPEEAWDSRAFGPLPLHSIVGRAVYRMSQFDRSDVENSSFARYFDESVLRRELPRFESMYDAMMRGDELGRALEQRQEFRAQ